ncbi:ABC-1 [Rubrobacter xylanophilus DSM 9941]|uniref:ABC-1 n=1 Tax=Rubrobacter xylanophilus (strain DSM 9941 / JCM 11954 / NBRC 16129 / PRD-1) TaxID=266117 RepID=Q1ATY3_RUBXD|nr:AarF/UbiB family protein [Rubrobacter xylanophilus]ABG05145.1 ABC-1 [Rubrobacter xylanophilus DSM 9941]
MDDVSRGLPEGPARRAARIARVGARYGFGFVFGRRLGPFRRGEPGRVGPRLRRSLEELGPVFAELGRFLSARRDLLPEEVAAELGRAEAPPKPASPAEVRGILERELGNAAERLFVAFEELPVRVGVFTQAHRATLPGDRPALVVVSRPGVRRELLAMRPAADVVRRRVGDRLPLDPVEAVSEFAAHAGHRRDMHLAAQNARRMRDLGDRLPLRVPGVYRDYSAARCLTLEAPAETGAPGAEGYRACADALVGLAVREGIFLADHAPERFAAGPGGELWLLDPTEAFSLDPERMRALAEVLAAAGREDVDGIIRSLPLAGASVPKNAAALRRELREALGALGGPLWREHSLARVRDSSLEALRRGGARLPDELCRLFGALVAAEELGRTMSGEGYLGTVPAAEAAREMISHRRNPRYVLERTARRLNRPEVYADYPRQIHALLEELKDGEVEVRFRHGGLDELISKLDILANRLVFAFLIAALIVGSSMLGVFVRGGPQVLGLSIFGFAGFVAAALLGLLLLVGIIRSGRL